MQALKTLLKENFLFLNQFERLKPREKLECFMANLFATRKLIFVQTIGIFDYASEQLVFYY